MIPVSFQNCCGSPGLVRGRSKPSVHPGMWLIRSKVSIICRKLSTNDLSSADGQAGEKLDGTAIFPPTHSRNQPVIEHLMDNISFLNLLGLKNALQKRKQTYLVPGDKEGGSCYAENDCPFSVHPGTSVMDISFCLLVSRFSMGLVCSQMEVGPQCWFLVELNC